MIDPFSDKQTIDIWILAYKEINERNGSFN